LPPLPWDSPLSALPSMGYRSESWQGRPEYVEAKKNPLEIKEIFKTLSRGDEAMRAIAFQAVEDAWFASAFKQGRPPLSEPTV
jgi:hypothetical protein